MTRPIKKARVTRRRKYYGGGKRRGGTTLKKVGGGEASNLRPTFEDDLWNGLTLGDIIKGNDKAKKVVTNLNLSSTPNVLNVFISPLTDIGKDVKNEIKEAWPIIRSKVAAVNPENYNDNFNEFIDNFVKETSKDYENLYAMLEYIKQVEVSIPPVKVSIPPKIETYMQKKYPTCVDALRAVQMCGDLQQKVEKEREILKIIFFVCFRDHGTLKQDNESFLNLLKMAPRVIENRVNFFERLLSDENGHLYTIQEDDFFSILFRRNKKDSSNTKVNILGNSGLHGTIDFGKKQIGFIRQIKEVQKIEEVHNDKGEKLFRTKNLTKKGKEEKIDVKSSSVFNVVSTMNNYVEMAKLEREEHDAWYNGIFDLYPSLKINNEKNEEKTATNEQFLNNWEKSFKEFKKKGVLPAGETDEQFIHEISDGVTIYYDTSRFKLLTKFSMCSNNKNDDPYVLAAFSNNADGTDPDFYVLTTHLESSKGEGPEKKRVKGLNEILKKVYQEIKEKPLIIGMDANTPVYQNFYEEKKSYEKASFSAEEKNENSFLDNNKLTTFLDNNNNELTTLQVMKSYSENIDWLIENKDRNGKINPDDTVIGDTVISVNKTRGFGTAQPWKMETEEYHLIDWLCILNKDTIKVINRAKLPKYNPTDSTVVNDLSNMLPTGYEKDGTLAKKIKDTWEVKGESNVNKIINGDTFSEQNGKQEYSWFSDHLPLAATLQFPGHENFNIVQNNVLSLLLGFDGFKESLPPDNSLDPN